MGPINSEKVFFFFFFLKIATWKHGEGGLEGNNGPRTDTGNTRSSRSSSREGQKPPLLSQSLVPVANSAEGVYFL